MKKQLLLISLLLGTLLAGAQITIVSGDMPSTGQTFNTSLSFDFQTYNFSETGSNYTWNYQELAPMMQRQNSFIPITQTPPALWLFFIGSANLASPIQGFDLIPGFPIEDGYQFYNKTNSLYSDAGLGILLSGLPVPLKYDAPDVLYRFPMTTGYSDTVNSGLALTIPGVGHITIIRERISEVDGWGTLNTPYGSFQTLRLKSFVSEYDSIFLDTLGQGLAINREYTEYKWLGKNRGLPLLNVTDDLVFGSTIIYLDSIRIMPPSNLSAMPVSTSQIDLSWDLNFGNDEVLLAWSANGVFGNPTGNYNVGGTISGGGTVLYIGSNENYSHMNLNAGSTYHYKLWSKSGTDYSPGISASAVTFSNPNLPGDSNCDGAVNVLDVVITVNYITGLNPQPFCFENADVNSDGQINVLDVVLTVEIILNN